MSKQNSAPAQAPTSQEDQAKIAEVHNQLHRQAIAVLNQRAYMPAFLGTLKKAGVVPQNQEELNSLLALAGQLRQGRQVEQVKQASVNRFGSYVSELSQLGLPNPLGDSHGVKQASAQLMHDDELVLEAGLALAQLEALYS